MRRYFPRLLGNEETKARVGAAIKRGTAAHAFLLGGPSGSGKSTLAIEMAAALNCMEKGNDSLPLPCGKCNSCKRIYEGNFPDIKILEKQKDRATIGVDAVKDFREDMFLSSTESEHKIYIVKNAECMTVESQNALLKVLEEPPRGVMIILLAEECDRILTTIKSRVQYIAMSRFTEDELVQHLLSRNDEAAILRRAEPEKFDGAIMSADGRLGRAEQLISKTHAEKNREDRLEVLKFISALGTKASFGDIYSAISALPTKRADLLVSLEKIISALRDLVIIKESSEAKTVFFVSREEAQRTGAEIGIKRLLHVYDAIIEAHLLCSRNANIGNITVSLASKIKLGVSR